MSGPRIVKGPHSESNCFQTLTDVKQALLLGMFERELMEVLEGKRVWSGMELLHERESAGIVGGADKPCGQNGWCGQWRLRGWSAVRASLSFESRKEACVRRLLGVISQQGRQVLLP